MPSMPTIRIEQQFAKIGIDRQPSKLEIRQPKANMEMETSPLQIGIRSPRGELRIDQSQAWDALGSGSHITFMNRIYSEAKQIATEGIARIVEDGNRMAAIQDNSDAIADLAAEHSFEGSGINYLGEPSYDNVDIDYIAHQPEYNVDPGSVDIKFTMNKPEINYTPGKVEVYMLQYPKVEIIPPQIDIKV